MKKKSTKQIALESGMNMLFFFCGMITVGFILCISIYLIISGTPAMAEIGLGKFFTGTV